MDTVRVAAKIWQVPPSMRWAVSATDDRGHKYVTGGAYLGPVMRDLSTLIRSTYWPNQIIIVTTGVEL